MGHRKSQSEVVTGVVARDSPNHSSKHLGHARSYARQSVVFRRLATAATNEFS